MAAYYNEFKPEAAHMLRQLIKDGIIAPGDVDERSITEVKADDIRNYTQCHFFAGIGGWSVALRVAGWDDARPVWTGSCPCQPFSTAGKQKGKNDERHLWPEWFRLIRELCPATIFGEQVESAIAHGWLDDVYNDMEAEGYAVGAAVLPACAVGKPHQRKRLWFVGLAKSGAGWDERQNERAGCDQIDALANSGGTRSGGCLSDNGASESSALGNAEYDGQPSRQVAGSEGAAIQHDTGWAKGASEFEGAGQSKHVANTACAKKQSSSTQRFHAEPSPESNGSSCSDVADPTRFLPQGCENGSWQREFRGNSKSHGDVVNTISERGRGGYGQRQNAENANPPSQGSEFEWISCPDGKSRPVKSGIRLLADGVQHRTPILHAFGNAIVPQVAAEFIKAAMSAE